MTVNPIGCLKFMKTKRGEKKSSHICDRKRKVVAKDSPETNHLMIGQARVSRHS